MWSSGKDSTLALSRARASGFKVSKLVSFFDATTERVRFHATRRRLLEAQADAVGVEFLPVPITWSDMSDALDRTLTSLRADGVEAIVMGNVHLQDVRDWYESRVRAAGLEHVDPLWAEPPADLLRGFLDAGGRAVITCVERGRLDAQWLGRELSLDLLDEQIDPCGENGEYHSFCFDGCGLEHPVEWLPGIRLQDGGFDQLDLVPAHCTECQTALQASSFYTCTVCPGPVLCSGCASSHLCTSECTARGCIAGMCVKEVARGRLAEGFGVENRPAPGPWVVGQSN